MRDKLQSDAYYKLEFAVMDNILELAKEAVGGDEEVPGCPRATKNVLCQVSVFPGVDNQEARLSNLKPVVQGISPLLCTSRDALKPLLKSYLSCL